MSLRESLYSNHDIAQSLLVELGSSFTCASHPYRERVHHYSKNNQSLPILWDIRIVGNLEGRSFTHKRQKIIAQGGESGASQ
jgi:hypothetical protein